MAAIPFLFKDRLVETTKDLINENLNAKVDFGAVGLSLFRDFPNLTLSLKDFEIAGVDDFESIRLASAEEVAVSLDILSVIGGGPIALKNIALDQPDIHILVLANGKANYDIAKPSTTPAQTNPEAAPLEYQIELDQYSIKNGKLIYDDASLNTFVDVSGLDHQGSGAFTATVYDLNTKTNIEGLTVNYGGIAYLNRAKAQLDAIFNIDQSTNTYRLKDNNLIVNALQLVANGMIQMKQDDIILDLDVDAPKNEFKNLLSIIPGAYLKGYEDVKADGQFLLNAKIEGIYNGAQEKMPAFAANLQVSDADVKYPDLPLGISNISAQASINSPGSNLDQMTVDIPKFNLQIGSNPVAGRFQLKKPLSNPTVDTKINGKLDLEELAQAFPVEGLETMTGQIVADIEAKASMKEIDQGDYENVNMKGAFQAQNVLYKNSAYPAIQVNQIDMNLSPKYVAIEEMDMKLGKSDIKGNGRIDNILAYFSPNTTMRGQLKVNSDYFLVDEWMPAAAETTAEPSAGQLDTSNTASSEMEVFDRFDFSVDAQAKEIVYDQYTLKNSALVGSFQPNALDIRQAATQIDESDINMNGQINNLMDYVYKGETLKGKVNINSNYLNLNPFMTIVESAEGTSTPTNSAEPSEAELAENGVILVPENIKVDINANVKDLLYTNMKIKNLAGLLKVDQQAVELREVKGNTLGGAVTFNGLYDTEDPKEPYYGMKLSLDKLNFQEAFKTLNTFQLLAPIGQFIEGIMNTSLSLDGTLGKGMMPNLNTLNAAGFLETIDGTIKKYPPLEKLGDKLRIIELKSGLAIENTKNWLEINNGMVEVKPFDFKVDDIPMTIAGKHGLTQTMDYNIKATIPKNKIDNNALSDAIGQSLSVVRQQASKLGIQIDEAESIDVMINLTGTIKDPQFKIQLLGADGQTSVKEVVANKVQEEVDKQKEKLGQVVEEEKEKLTQKADQVIDSAKTVLNQKVDDLKKEAGSKVDSLIKKKADTLLKKEASKVLDTLLKNTEIDKVKQELEKFNPFKKKKKTTPDTTKTGND